MTTARCDTLSSMLEHAAASQTGVRFLDRSEQATYYAYAEVYRRAQQVAGALMASGLRTGDRVGLIVPTSIDFYDAFFGSLLAGATPVPLYPPVRLGRIDEYHEQTARMLNAAECRVLLTNKRLQRVLGRTAELSTLPLGVTRVETCIDGRPARVRTRPDQLGLVQFSSGSTTSPKPVALTHAQLTANIRTILATLRTPYGSSDFEHRGVAWLPLYHDMGLIGCVLSAVAQPGEMTLIPPEQFVAKPALWLRAISRYGATISAAPNFAYALCAERIRDAELDGVDLSQWLLALNGAEPVTARAMDHFIRRFAAWGLRPETLTPVYGLAEATLAVTFSSPSDRYVLHNFARSPLLEQGRAVLATPKVPDQQLTSASTAATPQAGAQRPAPLAAAERGASSVTQAPASARSANAGSADTVALVSCGRPLPGNEIRIVDDADAPVPPGCLGRIQTRGPAVMHGYLGQPEATAATVHDGWLETGDTGFLWEGQLYLFGRAKDVIVLRGRNYAPQDIEQVVDELEGVRRGCTVAVGAVLEASHAGEELLILSEYRANAAATSVAELPERIRKRVLDALGLRAARVEALAPGTLPRTSSGKLRRSEARRRYLSGALTPPKRMGAVGIAREMWRSAAAMRRKQQDTDT